MIEIAGYHNFSMSNNAVAAYNNDEMPRSKWTKAEILAHCGEKAAMLRDLTVAELRNELLEGRGWHHTSSRYNRTDFFGIDEFRLDEISAEDVAAIIAARKPRALRQSPAVKLITAEISYTVWEGRFRNYQHPVDYTETVTYKSTDKLISTKNGGVKRLSSLKSVRVLSEEPLEETKPSVKDRLKEAGGARTDAPKAPSPRKEDYSL